jgi:hypothetical protein
MGRGAFIKQGEGEKMKGYLNMVVPILGVCVSPAFAYETQIQGEFHGWEGSSVYELMDGSVVKQMDYHYH